MMRSRSRPIRKAVVSWKWVAESVTSLCTSHGPGPNMGDEEVVYNYLAWVTQDPEGLEENDLFVRGFDPVRGIPIDPEVGNQPQP